MSIGRTHKSLSRRRFSTKKTEVSIVLEQNSGGGGLKMKELLYGFPLVTEDPNDDTDTTMINTK